MSLFRRRSRARVLVGVVSLLLIVAMGVVRFDVAGRASAVADEMSDRSDQPTVADVLERGHSATTAVESGRSRAPLATAPLVLAIVASGALVVLAAIDVSSRSRHRIGVPHTRGPPLAR